MSEKLAVSENGNTEKIVNWS